MCANIESNKISPLINQYLIGLSNGGVLMQRGFAKSLNLK